MLGPVSEKRLSSRLAIALITCCSLGSAVSCGSLNYELKNISGVVREPSIQAVSSPELTDQWDQRAKLLKRLYDERNCAQFVGTFPATPDEFQRLYGYDDVRGPSALFSESGRQVSYFFTCTNTSEKKRLEKVIMFGLEPRANDFEMVWEFKDSAIPFIRNNRKLVTEILDSLPDEKAASFWYFLFDLPTPLDPARIEQAKKLENALGRNSRQAKLLREQYAKLTAEWGNP